MARQPLPSSAISLADGLVYFWPGGRPQHEGYIYFMQTSSLYYENFCADFGPFNLAMTVRFLKRFEALMKKSEETGDPLVFIAPADMQERSNAAALVSIAVMVLTGMTPEETCKPLDEIQPPLLPFRDASYRPSTFDLHVRDVVAGVYQGLLNGFVDLTTFSPEEYDFYERIEHGDFNWMVADKFISMAGPHNQRHINNGYPHFAPEDFVWYFQQHNVTDVVRLNAPLYDRTKFTRHGLRHHDMCFTDGTTPPPHILRQFLDACESAEGAIAVHCKAGLGRTGTLMACYIMKHYKLTAREAIAWLRVARPGSVIGPQQHYVVQQQQHMWEEGASLGAERKTHAHRPTWILDMVVAPRGSGTQQAATATATATATAAPAYADSDVDSAATSETASTATSASTTATTSRVASTGSMDVPSSSPQQATPTRVGASTAAAATSSDSSSDDHKDSKEQEGQGEQEEQANGQQDKKTASLRLPAVTTKSPHQRRTSPRRRSGSKAAAQAAAEPGTTATATASRTGRVQTRTATTKGASPVAGTHRGARARAAPASTSPSSPSPSLPVSSWRASTRRSTRIAEQDNRNRLLRRSSSSSSSSSGETEGDVHRTMKSDKTAAGVRRSPRRGVKKPTKPAATAADNSGATAGAVREGDKAEEAYEEQQRRAIQNALEQRAEAAGDNTGTAVAARARSKVVAMSSVSSTASSDISNRCSTMLSTSTGSSGSSAGDTDVDDGVVVGETAVGGGDLQQKHAKQEPPLGSRPASSVFSDTDDERTHMTQGDELTMRKAQAQAQRGQRVAGIAPPPSTMHTPKRRSSAVHDLSKTNPRRLVPPTEAL
ncbi:Cdc14A3 phosphatase [Salpingoeca rosetta]|uniref:protein-tyrosine-phosphatase n=1 Tax=Salpingoeca rosetta (strain ATCC 50818 / BSB-021) TaxID=946362 RepID=F2ULW5_SALR5|nr:Cdc14A3 phosphatase [Salpingoeca rosetta]EGD78114.1 Cdc14A3 phosphatase [Salpingoeca rosetta]|eukprot:XP_004989790.1 Cdc14A3 phosphatase [Salpingoeca rosetta]